MDYDENIFTHKRGILLIGATINLLIHTITTFLVEETYEGFFSRTTNLA